MGAPGDLTAIPDWARRARSKWKHTGVDRPARAVEPRPGQESVWDYPRPPRLEPDFREVLVAAPAGDELARTHEAMRVLETSSPPTYYVPPETVHWDRLEPAEGCSRCEWKGEARYWRIARDRSRQPVAWSYPRPFPEYERLRDYLAFYPGRVECRVAAERVRAQAGGFYGGWITDEIAGPFKGEPGTEGW